MAILPNGTVNEAYRPLAISMYHQHVHRWLEVFHRDQILVVNGDQLIEDPLTQVKRIETFLGKCRERISFSFFRFFTLYSKLFLPFNGYTYHVHLPSTHTLHTHTS